ncbi:hypothetical protein CROQUDRAFT_663956 [Cronartium quercuum f. sp. fusiforme G11]|uniref:Carboxypeptidase n=1 Tax=Cronartium quercuum f. sp. fusiforme G11 TaxID=708437 RepID=A0A9P6NC94_9BASI|nr:hypothetical protein CROQUDRAFT_663956 [Cronartium quercuum f. sp. fusiforme G11]
MNYLIWILLITLSLIEKSIITQQKLVKSHQIIQRNYTDSIDHFSSSNLLKFNSPNAEKFYVNGKNITFVDFDAGPSYAGLIPVSSNPGETRQLFFWFWPSESDIGANDLTFWTNGGPGCSSLESLLQETGPISWRLGQARPVKNPFSWTKLSSMLYVEQPVGTGYSEGKVQAHNETDIARDLFGFFQQWLKVFPEMCHKNFYLTGESYAGYYIPYIADYIYTHQSDLSLPLQGIYIIDPVLSYNVVQNEIPAWPMVQRYEYVFGINKTFKAELETLHHECGYADYISKYHTFPPPPGPFPIPAVGTYDDPSSVNETCALWEKIYNASVIVNPAFDVYHIFDTEPILWDVLSGTTEGSQLWPNQKGDPTYFNRTEVKQMLHVPISSNWSECSYKDVFIDHDSSVPVSMSVLPGVIEKSKRTIIAHGLADFVLIAMGARIAIQNMTWHGSQGFSKPIEKDFLVEGQGTMGRWQLERGLMYAEIELSGHMLPQYQPKAAYQMFQYLLGQIDSPSALSV